MALRPSAEGIGEHPISLKDALSASPLDDCSYTTFMHPDHGHGGSANGGFCVSQLLTALKIQFCTTLKHLGQPDTYCVQVSFMSRVPDGEALIKFGQLAPGRLFSFIQFAIFVRGKNAVTGQACHTNLGLKVGQTLTISNVLHPRPAPADFDKMANNSDPYWIRFVLPWDPSSLIKTFLHFERWIPRSAHPLNYQEFWLRMLPHGLRITTEMLGSLVDAYPRTGENWREGSPGNHTSLLAHSYAQQQADILLSSSATVAAELVSASQHGKHGLSQEDDPGMARQGLAYPTIMMNLEIKKKLPADGVEWMYCRATTKSARGGRLDVDVVLMDECGDVVATSNQIGLMVDINTNQMRRLYTGLRDSKI
ncbi:MAG: hypothetical protein Q9159_001751 [Coniocarpon cinnabarinum]